MDNIRKWAKRYAVHVSAIIVIIIVLIILILFAILAPLVSKRPWCSEPPGASGSGS